MGVNDRGFFFGCPEGRWEKGKTQMGRTDLPLESNDGLLLLLLLLKKKKWWQWCRCLSRESLEFLRRPGRRSRKKCGPVGRPPPDWGDPCPNWWPAGYHRRSTWSKTCPECLKSNPNHVPINISNLDSNQTWEKKVAYMQHLRTRLEKKF